MRYAIMHGPNLNMLGVRAPEKYGTQTLDDIRADVEATATMLGVETLHYQSNHEGFLIDWIQEHYRNLHGIVINTAGLTPYGNSLKHALMDCRLPLACVHMSEVYRYVPNHTDLFKDIASIYMVGAGWKSYSLALRALHDKIGK